MPPPRPTKSQPRASTRNSSRRNPSAQSPRQTVPRSTRQNPMLVAGMSPYSPVERGPVVPQVAPAPSARRYPARRLVRDVVCGAVVIGPKDRDPPTQKVGASRAAPLRSRLSNDGELAPQHRYRLATEHDARAIQAYAHHATARRRLVGRHLGLVEALAPERRERAVRRSGGRILANTNPRREEARYEVVAARGRATRHYDATGVHPLEAGEVRLEGADVVLGLELDEVVEVAAAHPASLCAQRVGEPGRRRGGRSGRKGSLGGPQQL